MFYLFTIFFRKNEKNWEPNYVLLVFLILIISEYIRVFENSDLTGLFYFWFSKTRRAMFLRVCLVAVFEIYFFVMKNEENRENFLVFILKNKENKKNMKSMFVCFFLKKNTKNT